MFTFEYKNSYGSLTLGGGSHPVWNVTEITGLGLVDKNVTSVTFKGEDGRLTTDMVLKERTITMSGDIISDDLTYEISRAVSILSHEGDIVINGKRLIHCGCVTFPDPERSGRVANFTMQFVCDQPYFGEAEELSVPVLDVENHLSEPFTLPMAFSTLTTYGSVSVGGDAKTFPIIYISNLGESDGGMITLINETTGKSISLDYFPGKYEVVEVDIDKRCVTGSVAGALLHCLTPDTRLSEFYLPCGENKIRLENNFDNINVTVKYRSKYASAIY